MGSPSSKLLIDYQKAVVTPAALKCPNLLRSATKKKCRLAAPGLVPNKTQFSLKFTNCFPTATKHSILPEKHLLLTPKSVEQKEVFKQF